MKINTLPQIYQQAAHQADSQIGDGDGSLNKAEVKSIYVDGSWPILGHYLSVSQAEPTLVARSESVVDAVSTKYIFNQKAENEQPILIPLSPGQMYYVELAYQDTRPIKDLLFSYYDKSGTEHQFRGKEWFDRLKEEQAGDIKIRREPDHNAPWIHNPIRVQMDVLLPDGSSIRLGDKFVDPHVHDAGHVSGSGSREIDNIFRRLPSRALPAGSILKLTPRMPNVQSWEKSLKKLNVEYVIPSHIPEHSSREIALSNSDYQKVGKSGISVDPTREIAGLMINWTDYGKPGYASISYNTADGQKQSTRYHVGSGETQLIPVGDILPDGVFHLHDSGATVDVRRVEVLYK